jgi:hypothetical protein
MSYRVDTRRSTEQPGRRVSPQAPTSRLEPPVDRPRRIDACIDYFGTGNARSLSDSSDACGESLLDGDERDARGLTAGPATS